MPGYQLLVRVVDKISDDKAKNIQLTKRNDVIVIKKIGEDWGIEELINPDWRIIQVPDMSDIEARAYLSKEVAPVNDPGAPVMKRAFRMDLDAMIVKGYKIDDPRPIKTRQDAITAITEKNIPAEVSAIAADCDHIQKEPSKNPNVIGFNEPVAIGF